MNKLITTLNKIMRVSPPQLPDTMHKDSPAVQGGRPRAMFINNNRLSPYTCSYTKIQLPKSYNETVHFIPSHRSGVKEWRHCHWVSNIKPSSVRSRLVTGSCWWENDTHFKLSKSIKTHPRWSRFWRVKNGNSVSYCPSCTYCYRGSWCGYRLLAKLYALYGAIHKHFSIGKQLT